MTLDLIYLVRGWRWIVAHFVDGETREAAQALLSCASSKEATVGSCKPGPC